MATNAPDRDTKINTEVNALLGPGTSFEGKLTFEGCVRIDGKFAGEIFSDDVLILGDGADVRATVEVGTLIIRGGLMVGDIRARELVEVHAPGRLYGNVEARQLYIEKGVVFEGKCKMTLNSEESAPDSVPPEAKSVAQPQLD